MGPDVWPDVESDSKVGFICFRCKRVSAGRRPVPTAAGLQEHFRQLRLRVSGRLRAGDAPSCAAVSR